MFNLLYIWNDWGILILRVFLGFAFLVHGLPKIKDLKQTSQNFEMMGFKPGNFFGPSIALLEFFGGIALILGAFVQTLALLFAIEMLVATFWKIKKGNGFVGGYEFDLSLLVIALMLLVSGSGPFSIDGYLTNLPF